jgi:hypothetical protein
MNDYASKSLFAPKGRIEVHGLGEGDSVGSRGDASSRADLKSPDIDQMADVPAISLIYCVSVLIHFGEM